MCHHYFHERGKEFAFGQNKTLPDPLPFKFSTLRIFSFVKWTCLEATIFDLTRNFDRMLKKIFRDRCHHFLVLLPRNFHSGQKKKYYAIYLQAYLEITMPLFEIS